ncbi:MAG TPA: hypothetical protein VGN52_01225 [Burkholderiales bacterium]|jgi:hypothetical protein
MPRLFVFCACLMVAVLAPLSAAAEEAVDDGLITKADVPADAPDFAGYPAKPLYKGRVAAPDVKTERRSRLYRTVIRLGVKDGVNFAGHYVMVDWGCGTGCSSHAIVDARTGRVFHPAELRYDDHSFVDADLFEGDTLYGEDSPFAYRADSRLLVIVSGVGDKRRGIFYYEWRGERLRLIRYVPHRPQGK